VLATGGIAQRSITTTFPHGERCSVSRIRQPNPRPRPPSPARLARPSPVYLSVLAGPTVFNVWHAWNRSPRLAVTSLRSTHGRLKPAPSPASPPKAAKPPDVPPCPPLAGPPVRLRRPLAHRGQRTRTMRRSAATRRGAHRTCTRLAG
jgi:hypothetical protein